MVILLALIAPGVRAKTTGVTVVGTVAVGTTGGARLVVRLVQYLPLFLVCSLKNMEILAYLSWDSVYVFLGN